MLLGEVISNRNEKASLGMAQKICSDYIEETRAVLRKVRFLVLLGVLVLCYLACVLLGKA